MDISRMFRSVAEDGASTGVFDRVKAHVLGINRLFLLTVVVPGVLSVLYFGAVASNVYVSESSFVLRSPEPQTASPLGMILRSSGFSRAADDSYTVHDFIQSRDALKQLDTRLAVGKGFSDPAIDVFSRFGAMGADDSFEALYRYYEKHVELQLDTSSSISTLTVRAYTPEDAWRINESLLEMSEALVNQLNERGRQDMVRFAAAEVADAEKHAQDAAFALSAYRDQKGVIDPEKQAAVQLQEILKLQYDQLMQAKVQLAQLQKFTPANPQIPALQSRVQTIQAEIDAESAKITGGDRSLANKTTEYERLSLEREFADKQLASALASLEQARSEAQRKQLYLERIVQPNKPDVAVEPHRLRNICATVGLGFVTWGILTILLAGVREHGE